jgi:mannosyltransferase
MKSKKIWLLGIFLLGIILRCLFIVRREIQYDDAFSMLLSQQSYPAIIKGTASDTMPPLYYFLLHAWNSLGMQIWWDRVLSVLLSLAGIWVLYRIVLLLADERAALMAAFFAAISPIQIYHAQDIRMYALLQLTQLAYTFFFIKLFLQDGLNENKGWVWGGLIVSGALSMYTHNLAVFFILIPDIILLFYRRWQLLKRLILAQVAIAVIVLPWLIYVPGQISKIQQAFWTPRPGILEIVQAIMMFTTTLPLPQNMLPLGLSLSITIIIFIGFMLFQRQYKGSSYPALIFLGIGLPLELFITSYVMRPVFVPRGFVVSSMFLYALIGLVLSKGIRKPAGVIITGAFLVCVGIALPYQYQFNQFPRSPFKETTQYLEANYSSDTLIVHDNKLSLFPSKIYDANLPQTFLADEPGSHNDTLAYDSQVALNLIPEQDISSTVGNYTSVDFVVFTQAIEEYKAAGLEDHPNISWLKDHYDLKHIEQIGDLEIYEFSK